MELPLAVLRDRPVTFDDVIAPLTRERFLAEFWEKKFLHLSGVKGRFAHLLPWQELNEILECHREPRLRLYQNDKPVEPGRYLDIKPGVTRINVGGLMACLSQGASMIMDAIQEAAPRIGDLAAQFQDVLDDPPIVNLYAGWGRQNAFALHWDPQEVFILQLSGRKHWKVYAPTRAHPLKVDETPVPQPSGPPAWEGILEDGDMLFMPRGWWHMAYPLDEPSLHLNFAIEPPTGDDFFRWLIPRLWRHPEIRQNLPRGCDAAGRRDYFAGLLNFMERDLDRDRVGEFQREWLAFRRTRPCVRLPLAPMEQKMPLTMASRLRLALRDGLNVENLPEERLARIHAGGSSYNIPPALIPAFTRLSGHASIPLKDISAGTDPQLLGILVSTLEALAVAGVLLKEAP